MARKAKRSVARGEPSVKLVLKAVSSDIANGGPCSRATARMFRSKRGECYAPRMLQIEALHDITIELMRQGETGVEVVEKAATIYRLLDAQMTTFRQALEAAEGRP